MDTSDGTESEDSSQDEQGTPKAKKKESKKQEPKAGTSKGENFEI